MELFIVEDDYITITLPDKEQKYSKGVYAVKALTQHYSIRKDNSYRIMFSLKKSNNHTITYKNVYSNFSSLFNNRLAKLKYSESIFALCKQISLFYPTKHLFINEKIECLLKLIFLDIYTNNIYHKIDYIPEQYSISQIETYIFNNYSQNITLQTLADIMYLSTKQVTRIIKKNYNKPLSKILNERRLLVASSLLIETDMPITKIMEYVGYNTENYFFSLFKQTYKISPLQYRKLNKKTDLLS